MSTPAIPVGPTAVVPTEATLPLTHTKTLATTKQKSKKQPSQKLIRRVIRYLQKHPSEITPSLRLRLLQNIAEMDTNQAMLLLASDVAHVEQQYPVERYLAEMNVSAWLLHHGKRSIDDSKIQSALQDGKAKKRGNFMIRTIRNLAYIQHSSATPTS